MPWLINAAQVDKFRKSQKNVVILDASWHLPMAARNAQEDYQAAHIVGARFLDLEGWHDPSNPLPNMLLRDEAVISQKLSALGISPDQKIIFYDRSLLHTSCRALWMFKVFGHNPNLLYILDGGFAAWEKYKGKIETGVSRDYTGKPYPVNYMAADVRTLVQMKSNLHHPVNQVVDLRHAIRFAGGAEHRQGIRCGHIPSSFCFPFTTLFQSDDRFKPLDKIAKQLNGIGLSLSDPIITLCGSGMSAAILNFVLDLMNHASHSLYDGSWSEWGAEALYSGEQDLTERPIVTSLDS